MRYSNNWNDYELIDCSDGKRLERWKDIILIRPDPQIIWKSPKKSKWWDKAHAEYFRSNKGGGSWKFYKNIPDSWNISYRDLKFQIHTMGFKHTGIFPEQAVNWDLTRELIKKSNKKDVSVLNLFAYTGASSVACLKGGAQVVHVDASKGMIKLAKENALLSGVSEGHIRYIVDDCFKFILREIRRGNKYDIIILDPPSYGRGPKGEIWKIEDQLFNLINHLLNLLSDDSIAVILNSYTTGLSAGVMEYLLQSIIENKRGGSVSADEIGIKISSGGILPCGAAAVWTSNGYY